jgi:hypothetical protein
VERCGAEQGRPGGRPVEGRPADGRWRGDRGAPGGCSRELEAGGRLARAAAPTVHVGRQDERRRRLGRRGAVTAGEGGAVALADDGRGKRRRQRSG